MTRRPARPSSAALAALVVAVGATALFLLVLADVLAEGTLYRHDPGLLVRIVRHRPEGSLEVAPWISALGAPVGVVLVGSAGAVVLRRRHATWPAALAPLVGAALAGLVTQASKAWWVPVRQPSGLRLPFEGGTTFPSGHTAGATALYVGLGLAVATTCRTRRARVVAVVAGAVVALLVGTSRLVLAVHWPTDVVGGWALGTAVAVGLWLGADRRDRQRARELRRTPCSAASAATPSPTPAAGRR